MNAEPRHREGSQQHRQGGQVHAQPVFLQALEETGGRLQTDTIDEEHQAHGLDLLGENQRRTPGSKSQAHEQDRCDAEPEIAGEFHLAQQVAQGNDQEYPGHGGVLKEG